MFGIKIAQPTKSVKSTNILDINVRNDIPFLKAFKQGQASVSVTKAGTYTVDITHGLGYFPFHMFFVAPDPNHPDRKYFGSFAAEGVGPNGGTIGSEAYVTKTALRLGWEDTTPNGWINYPYTVTFYYYIFYDKLE